MQNRTKVISKQAKKRETYFKSMSVVFIPAQYNCQIVTSPVLYNPYVLLYTSARVGDCVWTSAKELGTATTEHQVDFTAQCIGTGDL